MITAEFLSGIAGAVLTLAFGYIPGLSTKYDALATEYKRLIMGALVILAGVGSVALACTGTGEVFGLTLQCNTGGMAEVITAIVSALIVNQSLYKITKG